MITKLLFILLLAVQVFSEDETPEAIEEYKVSLNVVNNTLTRMYEVMEAQVQTDKDFIEDSLKEAMTQLKLKEKRQSGPRAKRELSQSLEDTYNYMKGNIGHAIDSIKSADVAKIANTAKEHASSSIQGIYSFFTNL